MHATEDRHDQEIRRALDLIQAIESRVRSFDIRDSIRAVLAQFRRSPAPTSEIAIGDDQEWDALVIMIREYGREETIENYSAFLFPF